MIAFTVNGVRKEIGVDANTPLLWVLREHLALTGTKFGCGIAACGACTVHVDGQATRACATPVSLVEGRSVTTIEGLSPDGSHPLQKAWIAEQVPQCGYCQSGQIMQVADLLARNKAPTREEIIERMDGKKLRSPLHGRHRLGEHVTERLCNGDQRHRINSARVSGGAMPSAHREHLHTHCENFCDSLAGQHRGFGRKHVAWY